ncbi:MAG TPA: DUF2059 domain-containing protein [Bryobacteraceae bacterium]|jgi:hypothetical protein|nr:DUF2059 domain-containing protein [Bryobacteraceae bacterium]
MRNFFVVALVLISGASSLFADAASKDAKIEEFLTLIKASALQDQIYNQLEGQIDRAAMGLAQNAGIPVAEQRSATADLQAEMIAAMKDSMNWAKLKPGMMDAYRTAYSEEELDGMITFFKSPVGQAYLAKSQGVAAKSREIAEAKVKELAAEFQTMGKAWAEQHPKAPALTPVPR